MENKVLFIGVDLSNSPPWSPGTVCPSEKYVESHFQQYGEYPEFIVMIAGGIFPTTLYFDGEGWFDVNNEYYNVTHWMPMPPAPGVSNV